MDVQRMVQEMWKDRRTAEEYLLNGRKAGSDKSWLNAVKIVEEQLGQRKKNLLSARREETKRKCRKGKGRPGWVVFVQMRYLERTANGEKEGELLGERTIHTWWNDIVMLTVEVHLRIR